MMGKIKLIDGRFFLPFLIVLTADALLAATAESENARLKTLNTRNYPMFKNLSPAYKK
jgi:predicted nucleic acid-binding protein